MTDFIIPLYRGTDDPPRTVRFEGLDATGKELKLVIQPTGKMRITLSTAGDALAKTDDEDGFVLSYTKDFVAGLPQGLNTTCDVFLINEDDTERKLASGVIKVGGEGEFFDDANAVVYVPGPQGIQGLQGPQGETGATGDVTPEAEAALAGAQSAQTATEAARDLALGYKDAAQGYSVTAQAASDAAVGAANEAPLSLATWSALSSVTPTYIGQRASVSASDAGTHTGRTDASPGSDVTGVANSGVYGAYALTPGAWRRDGALNITGTASGAAAIAGSSTTEAVTPSSLKSALQFGPSAALGTGSGGGAYDTFTVRGVMSALMVAGSAGYRYRGQALSRAVAPGESVTVVYFLNQATVSGSTNRFALFRAGTGIVSATAGSVANIVNNPGIVQSMVLTNTHASLNALELILDTNGVATVDIDYIVLLGNWTDTVAKQNTLFHLLLFFAKALALPARDNTVRGTGLLTGAIANTSIDTLVQNGFSDVSFTEANGAAAQYARSVISSIASGATATLFYRALPVGNKPITGSMNVRLERLGLNDASNSVNLVLDGRFRAADFTTTQSPDRILWNSFKCDVRIQYLLVPGLRSENTAASTQLQALILSLLNMLTGVTPQEVWTDDDTRILWPSPCAFVTGRDTRIFTRQVVKGRQRQTELDVSLISPAAESDNDSGFNELLGPTLRFKGEQLKGSSCFWDVKGGHISNGSVKRRFFTRYLATPSQTGDILFTMLGDSTAALGLNALRNRVNASGANFVGKGTLASGGIPYEGRAGWASLNYLGQARPAGGNPFLRSLTVANPSDLAILEANPNVCFANDDPALSYAPGTDGRTSYAADVAAGTVKASYSIFDFAHWRTDAAVALTGTEKLRVGFQLGRNGSTSASFVANETVAQTHIVENFRSSFPNGTIFVSSETVGEGNDTANYSTAPTTYRERTSDLIALKLKLFSGREADRVWLVPAWAMMNAFGGYKASNVLATDTDTGTLFMEIEDVVHYNGELAVQWAEAILAPLLYVHQTT